MNHLHNQFTVEFNGSYLSDLTYLSIILVSESVSNSKSYTIIINIYRCLIWLVQVRVVVWQKFVFVIVTVSHLLTSLLQSHPWLLLLHVSHELYWVTAPYLHWRHYSSRGDHAVWQHNSTILDDSAFEDNRVMPDEGSFLEDAGVQSGPMVHNNIILNFNMSRQSRRCRRSSMQHTVIANKHICINSTLIK